MNSNYQTPDSRIEALVPNDKPLKIILKTCIKRKELDPNRDLSVELITNVHKYIM